MTKTTENIATDMRRVTEGLRDAAEGVRRSLAPLVRSINVDSGNDPHVESLSDFLLARDWPTTTVTPSRRIQYRRRAAAILAGDAAAIRETWPEAAHEIATRSAW